MEGKTQKALIIDQYGTKPYLREDYPIAALKDGELLIKVAASTINPSDRIFLKGDYFKRPLPAMCGFEGTGTVVEARGEALQCWVGKRVCFTSNTGAWCQYAITTPLNTFQIDSDIPLSSASSGIINPLTVIGFIENFRQQGCKGIIHTAAASSLGKMLVKICLKEKIPLLNIVRREEQAAVLRKEGATHVLVTGQGWEIKLREEIEKWGFDCVYDALGGGPITQQIISNLPQDSVYNLYGFLENKPLTLTNTAILFTGIKITGFLVFNWWAKLNEEIRNKVRRQYSQLLRNQLSTQMYKEVMLESIEEGLGLSVERANQGKIMVRI